MFGGDQERKLQVSARQEHQSASLLTDTIPRSPWWHLAQVSAFATHCFDLGHTLNRRGENGRRWLCSRVQLPLQTAMCFYDSECWQPPPWGQAPAWIAFVINHHGQQRCMCECLIKACWKVDRWIEGLDLLWTASVLCVVTWLAHCKTFKQLPGGYSSVPRGCVEGFWVVRVASYGILCVHVYV